MIDEIKRGINQIFCQVVDRNGRYWYKDQFIRWGRVEKDIHTILERHISDCKLNATICEYCDGRHAKIASILEEH